MSNSEARLVELIKRWKQCIDYEASQVITCEIGCEIGFLNRMPEKPEELSEEQRRRILELIDKNYSTAYNLAKTSLAKEQLYYKWAV
jgi:ribosome biogenesis SPOUT family RNA methylase Rps3